MCDDGGDDDLCILCNPPKPKPVTAAMGGDFPPGAPEPVPPGPDPDGFPIPGPGDGRLSLSN